MGQHLARLPEARRSLVAFCCRSGYQDRAAMMDTPIDELQEFASDLEDLLKREAEAFNEATRQRGR